MTDIIEKAVVGIAILFAVFLVLTIIVAVAFSFGLGNARAPSSYTGHVVDVVEDKGIIFRPTWVNMKTNPRSSDIQSYCIPPDREDELLPEFYAAMEDGGRYTIEYERPIFVGVWDCKQDQSIITGIRKVNTTALG